MARSNKDKTLTDNDRTLLNLQRPDIEKVLPDFFVADSPKLIKLFEKYYQLLDSDNMPNDIIKKLYQTKDATQTPTRNLEFLEDDLLLGNAYFGGFLNKREAIKFSNTLYRSKGSKYSYEQFFRGFFGVDPTIEYPKDKIFVVGPAIDLQLDSDNDSGGQVKIEASRLGVESGKFITDDKLYQQLAILIKSEIPIGDFLNALKLFVHPGGIYLGSEILLVSQNENPITITQDEVGDPIPETLQQTGIASFELAGVEQTTLLYDSDQVTRRLSTKSMIDMYQNATAQQLATGFTTFRKAFTEGSIGMDDSGTADSSGVVRTFAVMSDSAQDSSIGKYDGKLVIHQSFDEHPYRTQFDSDSA